MLRDVSLASNEVYHIYNRGAHKQDIFTCEQDYQRFMLLLHVSNTSGPVNMRALLSKYQGRSFADIYDLEKPDKSLADVMAFCLMPNHFHLVLRQKENQGISIFARKLMTGYSMYFNTKYNHSGVLFQGRFKSRHIDSEPYFRYIFSYVHLNPLALVEPAWEGGVWSDRSAVESFLHKYQYSSFYDYNIAERPERSILAFEDRPDFLRTQNDFSELLNWYEAEKQLTKDRPLQFTEDGPR